MSKARSKSAKTKVATETPGALDKAARNRKRLLVPFSALLVTQVLLPADAATPADGAGVPLAMLWLLLVLLWLVGVVWLRQQVVRCAAVDWAVLLLILMQGVSAVWATHHGAARPAINAAWEWIGMGCGYFLARQLIREPAEIRATIAVMIALAVALAAYSYYQIAVEFPEQREMYELDPDNELKKALGISAGGEADPWARKQFEARLYSPEPYATFALANSLAGYLVPWLICLVGIVPAVWRAGQGGRRISCGLSFVAFGIAGSLILTRSRAGLIAALAALFLLVLWRLWANGRKSAALVICSAALLAAAIAGTALFQLDHPAVAAARTSAVYRFEYWRATFGMIADQRWLGCGPGNFADVYTAYKLPEAAEEIADPHNLLLEVWSTAGTLAAAALLTALGCFFYRAAVSRPPRSQPPESAIAARAPAAAQRAAHPRHIMAGAAAGFVLSGVLARFFFVLIESGFDFEAAAIMFIVWLMALWLLRPWIWTGTISPQLLAVSLAGLLIHLLASGGIGNHGVAGSLWLVMALGMNAIDATSARLTYEFPKAATIATIAAVLSVTALCQRSAYSPIFKSRTALISSKLAAREGDTELAASKLREAVSADPLAAEPRRRLARQAYRAALSTVRESGSLQAGQVQLEARQFDNLVANWLATAPRRSRTYRETGDMYLNLYLLLGRDRQNLGNAIDAYRMAIDHYPNNANLHAHLAWAHQLAGDRSAAKASAREALRLDELNPHADQRLGSRFQTFADRTVQPGNIAEKMREILNAR